MLERNLEKKCNDHAEAEGWLHVKLDLAQRSWPDQCYLGPLGQMLLVEFKLPGEKPRKHQAATFAKLERLGHPVSVVTSYSAFCELLASSAALAGAEPQSTE